MKTNATPATGQTCPDTSGITPNAVIDALWAMRRPSGAGKALTLREMGKRLGINPGYLSNILLGKKQPSAKVYRALGLPPPARVVEVAEGFDVAPVCAKCGTVHVTKRCTKGKTSKPRAKAFKWGGVRYVRHAGTDQI